ncbi:uncharacterized protein LOC143285189 [Babylonia areolata]|uniref:uncharacterized protein LOC143285189 n=1 Tax=Babylonia areolata TaxID=304850 RepID=UPI003FD5A390
MVVLSRRQMSHLLHERRKAMADTRFRPENFHEIHRVLGVQYAPDLTRIASKQRANAASAYLRRLQRDVQRSKGGFYDQLQALPLQIKRMKIHEEDARSFKSVLVPKLKLPTVAEDGGSTSSSQAVSPKTTSPKSVSPGAGLPPLVLTTGSNFVPHSSFSPHTNTHIHVLYKQGPGSVTPRKGPGSVTSIAPSVQGTNSVADPKSRRSSLHFQTSPKQSPREEAKPKTAEDSESDSGSSMQDSPQPYSSFKLATDQAPLPHIKKRLFVNLMPRSQPPREQEHQPVESTPASRLVSRKGRNSIPPKVAAALAAGGSPSTALYKFTLPSNLAASYRSLPEERPKAFLMGGKARHPLPSIPAKTSTSSHLLAVTSVRPSYAMQVAA